MSEEAKALQAYLEKRTLPELGFDLLSSFLLSSSCLSPLPTQAWALFKGKFREGIDKPDPPTWKTRLRCALNKSNDFEELVDRSQLDISDPYKVYRIVPEGAKKGGDLGWGPPT